MRVAGLTSRVWSQRRSLRRPRGNRPSEGLTSNDVQGTSASPSCLWCVREPAAVLGPPSATPVGHRWRSARGPGASMLPRLWSHHDARGRGRDPPPAVLAPGDRGCLGEAASRCLLGGVHGDLPEACEARGDDGAGGHTRRGRRRRSFEGPTRRALTSRRHGLHAVHHRRPESRP